MSSNSWHELLVYVSPAVVALLLAIAKWVESRARITSEVARAISQERVQTSREGRAKRRRRGSAKGVQARKKLSTKVTISTSPGDDDVADQLQR